MVEGMFIMKRTTVRCREGTISGKMEETDRRCYRGRAGRRGFLPVILFGHKNATILREKESFSVTSFSYHSNFLTFFGKKANGSRCTEGRKSVLNRWKHTPTPLWTCWCGYDFSTHLFNLQQPSWVLTLGSPGCSWRFVVGDCDNVAGSSGVAQVPRRSRGWSWG